MKKIIRIAIFSLAATTIAQEAPVWVVDKNARFPDIQFVSALGSGRTAQESRDDAVSQISLYFNSHVSVEQEARLRITEGEGRRRQAESGVSVASDAELPQLSFTSPFKNEKTGEWFVCTYIERSSASEFCAARIGRILASAESAVGAISGQAISLADAGRLAAARDDAAQAEMLLESLIALSRSSQNTYAVRIQRLQSSIRALLEKARKGATFRISIQGDDTGTIATVIEELLASDGMTVSERGRYFISGSITMSMSENEVGVFARPGISLRIIDGTTDEQVNSFTRQYKKWGHKTEDGARAKALAEIEKDLRENFHPAGER